MYPVTVVRCAPTVSSGATNSAATSFDRNDRLIQDPFIEHSQNPSPAHLSRPSLVSPSQLHSRSNLHV